MEAMYRAIITLEKNAYTIQLPDEMVGKEIEVIAFETHSKTHQMPHSLDLPKSEFWDTFGAGKDSTLNIDEVRAKAWR